MTRVADSYATVRRQWIDTIANEARASRLRQRIGPPPPGGWWLTFWWREAERRRDKDNVRAGGTKLILDAFKAAGIWPDDGNSYVAGFAGDFFSYTCPWNGVAVGFGETYDNAGKDDRLFALRHVLPDENTMLALREIGARRSVGRHGRPISPSLAAAIARATGGHVVRR